MCSYYNVYTHRLPRSLYTITLYLLTMTPTPISTAATKTFKASKVVQPSIAILSTPGVRPRLINPLAYLSL